MSDNEGPPPAEGPACDPEQPRHELWPQLAQLLELNDNLLSYVSRWARSRADAKDIVSEAYSRIFRLHDPTAITHLRAYLFRTARNIATDWVRQRIVREAFMEEEPLRVPHEAPSPEQIWLAREALEALQRRVETLPPRSKLALLMVKEDGLSYQEVGARLGIKTHSARRLVERALEFLVADGDDEGTAPRGKS